MFRANYSTTATYYPKNPESGTALDGLDYRQARYYDSDLGLFLSVDPLGAKYPDWSPYVYVYNNPIVYIDPDGKEPNRTQSTTIEGFIAYCLKNELFTAYDIYIHFKNNSGEVPRYIYTQDRGWMDMNHIFSVMQNGLIPTNLLEPISGNKMLRDRFLKGQGAQSYYSYEDLPSNYFGHEIKTSVSELKSGAALFSLLLTEFQKANTTEPENAPNYRQIPFKEDRGVILDDNGNVKKLTKAETASGNYVPQNFSFKPYDLTNFPAAKDSLDKQIGPRREDGSF